MGQMVITGASCTCTFGTAPGTINVTSQTQVLSSGAPCATIQDCQSTNISPFGLCTSLANPAVASATAAAMGVLTPQPCTLVPAGTWIPASPTVMVGGKPCLTSDAKLMCGYAGSISIVNPGQGTTNVK